MLLQIHEPGQSPLPHEEEEIAIGIDLGTTNSLIAYSKDEKPFCIEDENGKVITPSILKTADDGKEISSIKRLMGIGIEDYNNSLQNFGFDIDEQKSDKVIYLNFGDKKITPIEASAEILKKLKNIAESKFDKKVTKAVITVPAYFNDAQRQATKDAAKLAGLEALRLINEPTAAALAYGLDKGAEGTYAVFDLGGGTFDVSILQMKMGVFKVIATGGDTILGGDDFDYEIAKFLKDKYSLKQEASELRQVAKELKEQLTESELANLVLEDESFKYKDTKEFEDIDLTVTPIFFSPRLRGELVGGARSEDTSGYIERGKIGSSETSTRKEKTREFAKDLKDNLTKQERNLWANLSSKKLQHYKFRKQYSIGKYIVDFVCLETGLVVELEGSQHYDNDYDKKRTEFLNKAGYSILRFWNNDVDSNLEAVCETILEVSNKLSGKAEVKITQREFKQCTQTLTNKTLEIFDSVLKDAEIEPNDLKGTVLVGGSTRMRNIKQALEDFLGTKPLDDINPDTVVALGAAVQAESLNHGTSNLLLDVTPLSLGLETYGGLMEVLIPRNSTIPTSASQKFTTYEDGQTAIKIQVLQGERELAKNCRSLAEFNLRGIPPLPSGTAVIEVTFMLDADGILTVKAREETTGTEQVIEVKPSYGLNAEEIEKILISSMEQAKADVLERLIQETRVEAEINIKNLQKALEIDGELIPDEYYNYLENQIKKLHNLVEKGTRDEIEAGIMNLNKAAHEFADMRVSNSIGKYIGGKKFDEI